jgi:hypothetical protein
LLRRHEAKSLYAWTPFGEASSHVAAQAPSPSWQFAWTQEMIWTQSVEQDESAAQQSSPAADPVPATMQAAHPWVPLTRLVSATPQLAPSRSETGPLSPAPVTPPSPSGELPPLGLEGELHGTVGVGTQRPSSGGCWLLDEQARTLARTGPATFAAMRALRVLGVLRVKTCAVVSKARSSPFLGLCDGRMSSADIAGQRARANRSRPLTLPAPSPAIGPSKGRPA